MHVPAAVAVSLGLGCVLSAGLPGAPSSAGPLAAAVRPATAAPRPAAASAGQYGLPVEPLRVVHPFAPPATPYGPGHLGADLAVAADTVVRAAGPGRVTFAGALAGRGVVVVLHPDGVRTEYEPVQPAVGAGDVVAAGAVLGRVRGTHHGCAPDRCLHWGARRGAGYLDPLVLLRGLGPVRLLPWGG